MSRVGGVRGWVLAFLVGTAGVGVGQEGVAGTLLVTNQGSGELAVLDEPSLAVQKLIPVGPRAWGVAVGRHGRRACVSHAGGVAFVDLGAGAVERRVALDGEGMGVALSSDEAVCYVAVHRPGGDRLVAVDRRSGRPRGELPIGPRAFGVYRSADDRTLYVPEHDGFSLSVVDTAAFAVRRTTPLRPLGEGAFDKPHYLAISPGGRRLYLAFQGRALVTVDTATLAAATHALKIEGHQHGIAISPDGRRLYVVNNVFGGEGSLSELDVPAFRELRRIPLGKDHEQVALGPAARRAYLTGGFALGGHDELTVVELDTATATRVGTGGTRPFGIVYVP